MVTERMRRVVSDITNCGHEAYCFHFDPLRTDTIEPRQAMRIAMNRLPNHDVLFAVIGSSRRSEGQLIEIGAALALGIPVYVACHVTAHEQCYVHTLAQASYTWATPAELSEGMRLLLQPTVVKSAEPAVL